MHCADFDGGNPLCDVIITECRCGFLYNQFSVTEQKTTSFYRDNTLYPVTMGVGSGGFSSFDELRYQATARFINANSTVRYDNAIADIGCAKGGCTLFPPKF